MSKKRRPIKLTDEFLKKVAERVDQMLIEEFLTEDIPEYTFSDEFERKMQKLIDSFDLNKNGSAADASDD